MVYVPIAGGAVALVVVADARADAAVVAGEADAVLALGAREARPTAALRLARLGTVAGAAVVAVVRAEVNLQTVI